MSTNSLNPCSPSFWYFSLSLCFASFYFCLLIFIKREKHWCNFAFWCNEMQLYDSATGSIKGHFKTQLSFFPLYPLTLTHDFVSIWSSLLFPSLWLWARPHFYSTTSTTHTNLLSSVIVLSSGLCSGTCSRILDCNGEDSPDERWGNVALYRPLQFLINQTFIWKAVFMVFQTLRKVWHGQCTHKSKNGIMDNVLINCCL